MFPEELMEVLDGGRACDGGHPPAEVHLGDAKVRNPQKDAPPQTILGAEQKAWFKDRQRTSSATWKIWGNSQGTLEHRADPQNRRVVSARITAKGLALVDGLDEPLDTLLGGGPGPPQGASDP